VNAVTGRGPIVTNTSTPDANGHLPENTINPVGNLWNYVANRVGDAMGNAGVEGGPR